MLSKKKKKKNEGKRQTILTRLKKQMEQDIWNYTTHMYFLDGWTSIECTSPDLAPCDLQIITQNQQSKSALQNFWKLKLYWAC